MPNDNLQATRLLNNIRQAYATLVQQVRSAVQTQVGDRTRLAETAARLSSFRNVAQQHRNVVPEEEWTVLERSLATMQEELNDAAQRSADPFDGPLPQPLTEVRTGRRGRPKKHIDPRFLEEGLYLAGTGRMGRSLGCHPRTVRRRALEAGLVQPCTAVRREETLPDGSRVEIWTSTGPLVSALTHNPQELDRAIADIHRNNPRYGENMTRASLLSQGHRVPRGPLVESLRRVLGPADPFGHRVIIRRKYNVPAVNSLWHHDGHHALIRFKLVTHCFIDGKSRMITGIRVSNNNRAQTVLNLFDEAIRHNGVPSRVRGDHGTENTLVAARMTDLMGRNRGSYIWGRSVHNVRIERLWRDYYIGAVSGWYDFFHDLEAFHQLDVDSPAHIWLLHFLFLVAVNMEAENWARTWNNHNLRTEGNQTPRQLFFFGLAEHGARGVGWREDGVVPGQYQEFGIDWEFLGDPQNRSMVQELARDGLGDPVVNPVDMLDNQPLVDEAPDPRRMNEVICEAPESGVSPEQVSMLQAELDGLFGQRAVDMTWEQRQTLWSSALDICRTRFQPEH